MDLGGPAGQQSAGGAATGNVDLLGGGLDDLAGLGGPAAPQPKPVSITKNLIVQVEQAFCF